MAQSITYGEEQLDKSKGGETSGEVPSLVDKMASDLHMCVWTTPPDRIEGISVSVEMLLLVIDILGIQKCHNPGPYQATRMSGQKEALDSPPH